jgi:FKBP-type peptidyl-prolyl cis-trans isomerase
MMARFSHRIAVAAMTAMLTLPAVAHDPAGEVDLSDDTRKASYAIGLNIGGGMKAQGVEVDLEALTAGLADALAGKEPRISPEQMQAAMMALQQKVQGQQMQRMREAGAKNAEDGKAYQDQNAKKEGVTTTASGLQYEVVQAGEGEKPGPTDIVTVHYTGTLIDGTVFDSSVRRGEPTSFPLDNVVPGWSEGVQLMNKGAKYRFVIPPDLAYGEQGAPGSPIGPNSTLIFEVELLDVKKDE